MQIRYIVKDVDEAVGFYANQFGFELIEQYGPAMAIMQADGGRLWLAGPPASASKPMPDGRLPEPGGWNRLVVTVADLDAVIGTLRQAGTVFRNDVTAGPGGRQILCEDPSGNPIELFEAVSS